MPNALRTWTACKAKDGKDTKILIHFFLKINHRTASYSIRLLVQYRQWQFYFPAHYGAKLGILCPMNYSIKTKYSPISSQLHILLSDSTIQFCIKVIRECKGKRYPLCMNRMSKISRMRALAFLQWSHTCNRKV